MPQRKSYKEVKPLRNMKFARTEPRTMFSPRGKRTNSLTHTSTLTYLAISTGTQTNGRLQAVPKPVALLPLQTMSSGRRNSSRDKSNTRTTRWSTQPPPPPDYDTEDGGDSIGPTSTTLDGLSSSSRGDEGQVRE